MKNVLEQDNTVQNSKKGPVRGSFLKPKLSKTHQDYWLTRLQQRTYKDKSGRCGRAADYTVRIKYLGREARVNLKSANTTQAAMKARDIYIYLMANGWKLTLEKYKPIYKKASKSTVGEFIKEVEEMSNISPKTLNNYISCFRRIVADIEGIEMGKKKFDRFNGGRKLWRDEIHAVKLSRITPGKIQKWKVAFIRRADHDPLKIKSASYTSNPYANKSI